MDLPDILVFGIGLSLIMKKECLVILNNIYPLESFLQNEFETGLYNNFKILVVPFTKSEDVSAIKGVPFTVIRTKSKNRGIHLVDIFEGVMHTFFNKYFYKELCSLNKRNKLSWINVKCAIRFCVGAESKLYRIKKELKLQEIDKMKVVFYSYWMHQHAYVAIKLKEEYPNSICISRCHGYDLYEYRAENNYIPFRKYILTHMDGIFPISKNGMDYLVDNYEGYFKREIKLSYLGTFDYGINPNNATEVFNIVTCSNMVALKRIDVLIKALAQIVDIKIKWTHYGDGELFVELKELAKEILPINIEWKFEGKLDNKTLMRRYQTEKIDLFLNVSETEGLPVSIMEAMSFGLPVLATDVGGTSEIVLDQYNGYLLPACIDEYGLANKIMEFYNLSLEKKTKMRANARITWETKFNAMENYKEFYSTMLRLGE